MVSLWYAGGNFLGSLLIGVLAGLAESRQVLGPEARLFFLSVLLADSQPFRRLPMRLFRSAATGK
jgi:hypothetical protein